MEAKTVNYLPILRMQFLEMTSKCDTSSAAFQSETTGLVDGTGSEEDILADIRSLVCMLPGNNEEGFFLGRM